MGGNLIMMEPDCIEVPSGVFTIGCTDDDKFCNRHELPRREITIRRFALGKYPISVGEFGRFRTESLGEDPGLPVVGVNWNEAAAFCEWLSSTTGETYRLPTEAEWEYACRAGTKTPFPDGYLPDPKRANLLHDEAGNRVGPGKRLKLGWGHPNAFGLFDLLGNVCEWVQDDWVPDYESLDSAGAAQVSQTGLKVIRGGGWDGMPRLARSSFRDFAPSDTQRDNLGFRIAKSL